MARDGCACRSIRFRSRRSVACSSRSTVARNALLVTPPSCGAAAGLVTLTAASDGATGSSAGATTIGPDCASGQLAPSFSLSSDDRRAGAESTMRGTIAVPARGPALTGANIRLPSGLLAHIGDVAECLESAAAAGQCPADTRIGSIRLVSGAGSAPAVFGGSLFIVPRAPGAVAGLAAVIDVRLGELDLGRLVLTGQFILRPTDAGLDLQMAFPTSFAGLGLHLREAEFVIDRSLFAVNRPPAARCPTAARSPAPEAARPRRAAPSPTTAAGAAVAPTLTAALGGETGPLGHPNVTVGLNARAGDSNLRGAEVTLPRGIAADPANIQNACPERTFQAAACSATARVGTTTARVGLTPEPIPGDVYLVKIDGQQLPGLGSASPDGTPSASSRPCASGPISGSSSVRCDPRPAAASTGPHDHRRPAGPDPRRGRQVPCGQRLGCVLPRSGRAGIEPHHPRTLPATRGQAGGAHALLHPWPERAAHRPRRAQPALGEGDAPAGLLVQPGTRREPPLRTVALDGGKASVKATNRTVQVFPSGKATTRLSLKLGAGTVLRSSTGPAGSRSVTVDVRLAFTDGSVQRQRIRLRAS